MVPIRTPISAPSGFCSWPKNAPGSTTRQWPRVATSSRGAEGRVGADRLCSAFAIAIATAFFSPEFFCCGIYDRIGVPPNEGLDELQTALAGYLQAHEQWKKDGRCNHSFSVRKEKTQDSTLYIHVRQALSKGWLLSSRMRAHEDHVCSACLCTNGTGQTCECSNPPNRESHCLSLVE